MGYYNSSSLSEGSCTACYDHCLECTEPYKCTKCKAANAVPDINSGCICPSGYYNTSSLATASCTACYSDCLECSQPYKCTVCKSSSAIPDQNFGCVCPFGYYNTSALSIGACSPCKKLCNLCTSIDNCLGCVDNGILSDSNCSCKVGYSESSASCSPKYFTASLEIDSKNILTITFSEDPNITLYAEAFELKISNTAFSSNFNRLNSTIYCIYFTFNADVAQNTALNVTVLFYPLYSVLGSQLLYYNYLINLNSYTYPISATIQAMAGMASGGTKAAASTAIASALIGNPAASWVIINTIQAMTYLPMNNNPLTPGLQTFLNSLAGYNMMPNPMIYIFDSNCTSPPYLEASNFGFNTSVFWINAGPTFAILLLLVSFLPFIYLISKFKLGITKLKLAKYLGNYRYGIFLRFWIQAYLDIGFFSLVQLKSVIAI